MNHDAINNDLWKDSETLENLSTTSLRRPYDTLSQDV